MKTFSNKSEIWFSKTASSEIRSLLPVFKKLESVYLDYIKAGEDNPCGYGERSHIGLLAAAAWLSGGTAIEEYGTSKKKNKSKKGRCDLWIKTNEADFECEAKRLWLNLKKDANCFRQKLDAELKLVVKEFGKYNREERRKLALCFAIPGIHCNSNKRNALDKLIRELIKFTKKTLDHDFDSCALVWIEIKKYDKKPMYGSHLLPGMLLAAVEVG